MKRTSRRTSASPTIDQPAQLSFLPKAPKKTTAPKKKLAKHKGKARASQALPRDEIKFSAGRIKFSRKKTGHYAHPKPPPDPRSGLKPRQLLYAALAAAPILLGSDLPFSIKSTIKTPLGPWTVEVTATKPH